MGRRGTPGPDRPPPPHTEFIGGSAAPKPEPDASLLLLTARREAYLVIARGAQRAREFPLRAAQVTIGRGEEADIQIDEPAASRRHAVIERRPSGFVLRDLASTNGTFHRGLVHGGETRLLHGDSFRIGETEFLFQDDGAAP